MTLDCILNITSGFRPWPFGRTPLPTYHLVQLKRLVDDPQEGMNAQGALMAISNAVRRRSAKMEFPATKRGTFPGNVSWPGPLPEHSEPPPTASEPRCIVCGMAEAHVVGGALKKCSACRSSGGYCGVDCQRRDWKVLGHKAACKKASSASGGATAGK